MALYRTETCSQSSSANGTMLMTAAPGTVGHHIKNVPGHGGARSFFGEAAIKSPCVIRCATFTGNGAANGMAFGTVTRGNIMESRHTNGASTSFLNAIVQVFQAGCACGTE